jgi:hypothetical protein
MTLTNTAVAKPPDVPSQVADNGKIVLGAGLRLPPVPSHVEDQGKIRLGAGLRLPLIRKIA